MTKGDDTRNMILQRAAEAFNLQGYFGTSMTDIMRVTGLEKGGIYNHFSSKDDLALQAFDYAVELIRQEFRAAVRENRDATARLQVVIAVYRHIAAGHPIPGGCPVSNTAREADHTHPQLRARAQAAYQEWQDFVRWIVIRGQRRGEIRADVDADSVAVFFIAALQGAVAISQVHDDLRYMDQATMQLLAFVEQLQ